MSRYTPSQDKAFVNALRERLGLAPLYDLSRSPEYWEAGYLRELARADGQVRKRLAI